MVENSKFILIACGLKDQILANSVMSALDKEVGLTMKLNVCENSEYVSTDEKLIENSLVVLLVVSNASKTDLHIAEFAKKVKYVNKEIFLIYDFKKPTWTMDKMCVEEYMFANFKNPNEMSVVYATLRDRYGMVRLPGDPVGRELYVVSEHSEDLCVYQIKDGKEENLGLRFRLDKGKHTIYMHFVKGKYKNYVIEKELNVMYPIGTQKLRVKDVFLDLKYEKSKKKAEKERYKWYKRSKVNRRDSKIIDFLFSQFNIMAILCVVGFFAIMVKPFYEGSLWKYSFILLAIFAVFSVIVYCLRFDGVQKIIDENRKKYDDIVEGKGKLIVHDSIGDLLVQSYNIKEK